MVGILWGSGLLAMLFCCLQGRYIARRKAKPASTVADEDHLRGREENENQSSNMKERVIQYLDQVFPAVLLANASFLQRLLSELQKASLLPDDLEVTDIG